MLGPIFKFSLDFSVLYQFSEEISWFPQICVKNPFSSRYYIWVEISWFPPSALKDLKNFWYWHRTGTFLPLPFQFFYNFSVWILRFSLSVLKNPQNLCWRLHNYLIIRLYFSLSIFFGLPLMVPSIIVFIQAFSFKNAMFGYMLEKTFYKISTIYLKSNPIYGMDLRTFKN